MSDEISKYLEVKTRKVSPERWAVADCRTRYAMMLGVAEFMLRSLLTGDAHQQTALREEFAEWLSRNRL
jgi:hypothetical protein